MTSEIASRGAAPPPELLAAMTAFRNGDFAAALADAERDLPQAVERGPYLGLASMAALRLGDFATAIPHLREMLDARPDDTATRGNLAKALVATGDLDEALYLCQGARTAALLRIEGYISQERGDLDRAGSAYEQVLALEPDDSASLNNLGNVLAQRGELDAAVATFERAITHAPSQVQIYLNLADVLRRADRGEPRLKVMQDAAALAPDDRQVLTELALAHAHADDFDEALALLEDVVRRFPDFGESHIELGRLYEALNRVEDLAALVRQLEESEAPAEAGFLGAWLAQREGRFDDAARLAATIPETVHPMRRFHLIGSIEERRGESEAAFAAFERMNSEALADAPPAPAESYRRSVFRGMEHWTQPWAAGWAPPPASELRARDPIFLVGFPRSGTTLLDTMLMGLPGLSVLEERPMVATLAQRIGGRDLASLEASDLIALRKDYFALAQQHGWDDRHWLVDKHPLNMTRVPLIHRLFPNARFILAERHPYDVVLSCFMANFQLNFAMRSFTSLDEAALTYDTVFSAWDRATELFAIDYRAVRYERLVGDPAAELRPLIDWLGLLWDDSLRDHTHNARSRGRVRTASYAQIGEKLYTRARYRWKRYAKQLAPVLPILEPWAVKLGYETG